VEEIVMTWPERCFSHEWKDGTGHVQRPEKIRRQLRLELLRRQFLEKAGKEVARVVDEHIDATEPLGRDTHRGFC
jgi:hypothetical protein